MFFYLDLCRCRYFNLKQINLVYVLQRDRSNVDLFYIPYIIVPDQLMSSTLVIDTSMERSLRVLRHGNPKIGFFFQRSSKFEF